MKHDVPRLRLAAGHLCNDPARSTPALFSQALQGADYHRQTQSRRTGMALGQGLNDRDISLLTIAQADAAMESSARALIFLLQNHVRST